MGINPLIQQENVTMTNTEVQTTNIKITEVENTLVEYHTRGCKHPFGAQGTSTPANEVWNFPPVMDDDAHIPGYSIKDWHWERDKKFEERLLTHYARMASDTFGGATMENYKKEYGDALRGIRSNNRHHLERIFKKAYEETYLAGDLDAEDSKDRVHDQAVKFFLATEEVLRAN